MRTDLWTPERDAELAKLWSEGSSVSIIAERLGVSKGSAGGRAARINLPARKVSSRKGRSGNVVACGTYKRATAAPKPTPRTFSAPPPPPSLEMIFRAAEKDGCRWMSGDPREMLFCGDATVRGGSYCEAHRARCYRAVAA